MRTQVECEKMLKLCEEKRDYWKKRILELEELKELGVEHSQQRSDYESNFAGWSQRVKTLEYVLGMNDII
jgi:hypothetical protein